MSAKGMRRAILGAAAAVLVPGLVYIAWNQSRANFATIQPGRLYRSGQMGDAMLARTIRDGRLKTIVNLRGANPRRPWYRAERAATLGGGATQVDIALSSCQWMSRAQLREVVRVLDGCEKPALIHCQWGSERTGLVSAFAELLRPGGTLGDAYAQFSLRYLFVRVRDGKIMAEHLDQYAAWLRQQGLPHRPDHFRRWAAEGFLPGVPSREQWPYDPLPLVVVTRPAPPPQARSAAREGAVRK